MSQSDFSNNTSANYGGALFQDVGAAARVGTSTSLEVTRSTFSGNTAVNGGAVASLARLESNANHVVTVTNSTFDENSSTKTGANGDGGGALFASADLSGTAKATWTLVNDTFFQNTSANQGAAAQLKISNGGTGTPVVELTSLTVYKNTAVDGAGGVVLDSIGNAKVRNSILSGNLVTGAGFTGPKDIRLFNGSTINDQGYNLKGSSDGGFSAGTNRTSDTPGVSNSLADNGAPSGYQQTLALVANSPAYRVGDTTLAGLPDPWKTDERGKSRQATNVSIGAYDPDAVSAGTGGGD